MAGKLLSDDEVFGPAGGAPAPAGGELLTDADVFGDQGGQDFNDPRDVQAQGIPTKTPPSSALQEENKPDMGRDFRRRVDALKGRGVALPEIEAAGGMLLDSVRGTETGKGAETGVYGAGQIVDGLKFFSATNQGRYVRDQLAAMQEIDNGKAPTLRQGPGNYALTYQAASPEKRAEIRKQFVRNAAQTREVQQAALSSWKEYQARIEKVTGRTPNLTDVGTAEDFGNWLAYNAGQGGVYIVPMMIAALGGPVTLGATSYAMGVGDLTQNRMGQFAGHPNLAMGGQQMERGTASSAPEVDRVGKEVERGAGVTAALAVPYALLDVALGPTATLAKGIITKGAERAAGQGIKAGVKAAAKQVGKDVAVEEPFNEGGQQFLQSLQDTILDDASLFTEANIKSWVNAAAAGAAGAVMPSAGHAAVAAAEASKGAPSSAGGKQPAKGIQDDKGVVNTTSDWKAAVSVFEPERDGDQTIYRAPNGARIDGEDSWNNASELVRSQWLTPEVSREATDVQPVQQPAAVGDAAAVQGVPQPLDAGVANEASPGAGGVARVPRPGVVNGIRVDDQLEAAPEPEVDERADLPIAAPQDVEEVQGIPAAETPPTLDAPLVEEVKPAPAPREALSSPLLDELERLQANEVDPAVQAEIGKKAKAERARLEAQRQSAEFLRASEDTKDPEVAADLRAKALKLAGFKEQREEKPKATGIKVADVEEVEALPPPSKEEIAARDSWMKAHGLTDATAEEAARIRHAVEINPPLVKQAAQLYANDHSKFMAVVEGVLNAKPEPGAAAANKPRRGAQQSVRRSGGDAAAGVPKVEGGPAAQKPAQAADVEAGSKAAVRDQPGGGGTEASGRAASRPAVRVTRTDSSGATRTVGEEPKTQLAPPPAQTDQDRLDGHARNIQRGFPGKKVGFAVAKEGDPGVTKQRMQMAQAAKKIVEAMGGKVVLFRHTGPLVTRGFSAPQEPGTIYVAVDADNTQMAVVGHEFGHWLKKNHPDLHDEFTKRIMPTLRGIDRHARERRERDAKHGQAYILTDKEALEELTSDVWGDFFTDPEFHADFAEREPSFYKRFAQALIKYIDEVVAKIGALRPLGSSAFIADMEKARSIAADTLAKLRTRVAEEKRLEQSVANAQAQFSELRESGPPFYSELFRGVMGINARSMTPQDWKLRIRSLKGVKADEIAWTGIEDWLDLQQGKVTKESVIDFINDNGPTVTTVELRQRDDWRSRLDELDNRGINNLTQTERDEFNDLRDRLDAEGRSGTPESEETKFDEYVLPGGRNYRELLITLPTTFRLPPGWRARRTADAPEGFGWEVVDDKGSQRGIGRDAQDAIADANTGNPPGKTKDFVSSHWDGRPNVVAHVRLTERTDAEGKRVLFLEEIQSDWAQQGKKYGFAETPNLTKPVVVYDREGDEVARFKSGLEAEAYIKENDPSMSRLGYVDTTSRGGVFSVGKAPRAPFVTKTESWVALALKRAIRYAAENGFERVAFANGEQNAAHYYLSKKVRMISWAPRDSGRNEKQILIEPFGGNDMEFIVGPDGIVQGMSGAHGAAAEIGGKHIADVVGKDLGKRILEEKSGEASGNGLTVGGRGMREFYDKIVPNVANDVLKKLGGGRVGEVSMGGVGKDVDIHQLSSGKWHASNDDEVFGVFDTRAEAERAAGVGMTQPGFDITDAMREKVMGGMPLFKELDERKPDPRSSVALMTGAEKLKTRANTTRAIAEALEARTRKVGAIDPYDESERARDKIAGAMADEVEHELNQEGGNGKSGVGWYSHNYPRAVERMSAVFPELKTSKQHRDLFTSLVAVFSNGQKVPVNARMAADAYRAITREGKSIAGSADAQGNRDTAPALRALQDAYAEYGPERVHEYLQEEVSVKDMNAALRKMGQKVSGDYPVDMMVPRAALVLGPKIGVFYANLMGSHGYLTMDRWWSRSFNRLRGSLIPTPTEQGIDRLRTLLAKEQGHSYANVDDDDVIIAAVPYWADYEAKNYKNGTDLEKAANTVIKAAALELNDIPERASDRRFMVDTAKRVQQVLAARGYHLTIADIQAAEWYYEKKLYAKLGAKDSGTVGYEEAINDLAARLGEDGRPVRSVSELVGARDRQVAQPGEGTQRAAAEQGQAPDEGRVQFAPPADEQLDVQFAPPSPLAQLEGERKFERLWFDKFNRTLQAEEAVNKVGSVADAESIRLAEKLFHGRAQHEGEELERQFVEPLAKELKAGKKLGLTVRDNDDYLMALHAPERNATMKARDPQGRDGLSGITDAQAQQIIASFTPAQIAQLNKVRAIVRAMTRANLDRLVNAGLITAATRAQLNAQWQNYVPLKTLEAEDKALGTGRGFEMWGNDIKTALGRLSKAGSPIAATIMDSTRTIIRAEKAKVEQTIWAFAQKPEAHDIMRPYDPDNPPASVMSRKLDPNTGVWKEVVDSGKVQEQTLHIMINGEDQRVYVPDDLLRQQLRKSGEYENLAPLLSHIATATRLVGRTLTEWNPSFTIPNAVKDALAAVVRARGINGMSAARLIAGIPKAWAAIAQYKRGKTTGLAAAYKEFTELGGKTGAYGITGWEAALQDLAHIGAELGYPDQQPGAVKRVLRKGHVILDALSAANEVLEYATRLSAYEEARRAGFSKQRAAEIGKEITVNFNRAGELSRGLNALFVFFNAALQGLYGSVNFARDGNRIIEPGSTTGKRTRRALYALAAIGFILQGLNEWLGGDDDETGEKNINTINDYQLDKNATFLLPGTSKGFKIPLPPEYSAAYAIGRRIYRAGSQRNFGKEAAGIVGNMLDATLPVRLPDSSNAPVSAVKALYPTVGLPWLEVAANENFMGQPIVPEQKDRNAPQPWNTIARRDTSDIAKAISEMLNTATGGDRIEPGKAQKFLGKYASPEAMQHIVGSYTGGLGQTVLQAKNVAKAARGDEEAVDINRAPIVGRFLFTQPKGYASRRYRELASDYQYAKRRIKAGEMPEDAAVASTIGVFDSAEADLRKLYPELRTAEERDDKEMAKAVRDQIAVTQKRVIEAYTGAKRASQ